MSETNPFLPQPPSDELFARVNTRILGNSLSDSHAEQLNAWRKALIADGEEALTDPFASGWMRRQFADPRLIDGLVAVEQETGVPATEYIRHSFRYDRWHHGGETFSPTYDPSPNETLGKIALGDHPLNIHASGKPRRHEEGHLISLNRVRTAGIDPSKVLFYRVTQPSPDTPKPEYYWTSDSVEVRGGLRLELGSQADTAIVLVSTLGEVAKNGGLIDDINDDQGHPVRQASFDSFDQNRALFTFPRHVAK